MKSKEHRGNCLLGLNNNLFALKLLFRSSPGMIIYRCVFSVLETVVYLTNLLFLRYAVNLVQNEGTYGAILRPLFFIIAMLVIYHSGKAVMDAVLLPHLEYRLQCGLKLTALDKANKFDLSCYDDPAFYKKYTIAFSEIVPRVTDVMASFQKFLSSCISLIMAGVLSYLIDPICALFALLPFLMMIPKKKKNSIEYDMNQKNMELNRQKGYVQRVFYKKEYAKELRMTNISLPLMSMFQKAIEKTRQVYKKYGFKLAIFWIVENILGRMFSQYLILFYAAWKTLIVGSMGYGDCVVIVSVVASLYESISAIISEMMNFHKHSLYIDNIHFLWENNPHISDDPNAPTASNGDIIINHLSFRYAGQPKDALHDISFSILQGEKLALVGPNGAGKTTLVKLLLRLYDPICGNISINGEDIRNSRLSTVRSLYSAVLQDYKHFACTIAQDVLLRDFYSEDIQIVTDALQRAGLVDVLEKAPRGIDSQLTKEFDPNGLVLSSGQNQKLAIARIYAQNTPIVILDEPSSMLDPKAEYELYRKMVDASKGRTLIIISHRISSAKLADHIIFLDNGMVIEDGTHSELMNLNGRYAEMYLKQAESYANLEDNV